MTTFPKNARVIFTGDSITAQTKYTARVVDHYKRNLPELNVKFFEGAISGSSLCHAIRFFNDMVLPFEPTHATVYYGINDCGLGWLSNQDKERARGELEKRYEAYKANLTTFVDMLLAHNITPILITPAPYAEFMAADTSCHKYGQKLSYEYAEVMRNEARSRGLELIDLHARMAELYIHEEDYSPDRVHPSDLGQYRIAECILRAQGQTIEPYRPLTELINDDPELALWQKTAFRFGRIYGMYVCVKPDLYDMPIEEQLDFTNEYVISRGYKDNNVSRDFSTEFVILKPKENKLIETLKELNDKFYV